MSSWTFDGQIVAMVLLSVVLVIGARRNCGSLFATGTVAAVFFVANYALPAFAGIHFSEGDGILLQFTLSDKIRANSVILLSMLAVVFGYIGVSKIIQGSAGAEQSKRQGASLPRWWTAVGMGLLLIGAISIGLLLRQQSTAMGNVLLTLSPSSRRELGISVPASRLLLNNFFTVGIAMTAFALLIQRSAWRRAGAYLLCYLGAAVLILSSGKRHEALILILAPFAWDAWVKIAGFNFLRISLTAVAVFAFLFGGILLRGVVYNLIGAAPAQIDAADSALNRPVEFYFNSLEFGAHEATVIAVADREAFFQGDTAAGFFVRNTWAGLTYIVPSAIFPEKIDIVDYGHVANTIATGLDNDVALAIGLPGVAYLIGALTGVIFFSLATGAMLCFADVFLARNRKRITALFLAPFFLVFAMHVVRFGPSGYVFITFYVYFGIAVLVAIAALKTGIPSERESA